MASYRKLPSGKWQATVRGRDGKRHTHTHRLQAVVKEWARDLEGKPQGDRRDPRAGNILVKDWHDRYAAAHAGKARTYTNASLWSVHCEPAWGTWKLNAVTRMEAQEWVTQVTQAASKRDGNPVKASTVAGAVSVMTSLYRAAIKDNIVTVNPFTNLDLPPVEPSAIFFYEPDEAAQLYDAMGEIGAQWRVLTELGMQAGLRFEELAGLHGHRVDWLRGQLEVIDVMTQRHGLRQWPKTRKSHRTVPVPPAILDGMASLMRGRGREEPVFTGPSGGPVLYSNFRYRIWYAAVAAAGVRKYPPRVLRHTAASWLVQDGVPLYDVQALLGHESFATTQRYAHLAPDAHSKVIESWKRRNAAGLAGP